VKVSTATQQDVSVRGEWVASTDGFVNAQIQPQVGGYLVRQDYKQGSEVRRGQVEIDPRPLQAALDQAHGQVAQTQAECKLTGINVKRDTPLAEAHAIAQSTQDNDLKMQEANKANVATAQASVSAAELNLSFTKVRSLIDGVAGQATLQVGNLVGTGSVLTSVSQLNPIKVFPHQCGDRGAAKCGAGDSNSDTDQILSPLRVSQAQSQLPAQVTIAGLTV